MDQYAALLALPSHVRKRLAAALESGLLTPPYSEASLRMAGGLADGGSEVASALVALQQAGIEGGGAATWLATIDEVACRLPRPDLVWSGPEVEGLHARDTRRVYEELLGSAKRSIWASSYVYFDGPRAFDALAKHMEDLPELAVTLLLNIQRTRGDTSTRDDVVRRFADRFWGTDWPGSVRPHVLYDPRALEPDHPGGVLHAKAVVTDEQAVFVTSANLTEAALDRNIELGLLVRDEALAAALICHFRALIDHGLLKPLPSA